MYSKTKHNDSRELHIKAKEQNVLQVQVVEIEEKNIPITLSKRGLNYEPWKVWMP